MIIGKIHPGSGLGDQLFSYITTRTIALNKGYDFGFVGKEFFKGKDFMNLDWGEEVPEGYEIMIMPNTGELRIISPHLKFIANKPYYDPEVNFIEDGTIIDGIGAQDERYWDLTRVRDWIQTERRNPEPYTCVINFRGGEFATVPDLFLSQEYWQEAMERVLKNYPTMKFEVHTDDMKLATVFFPGIPIIQNIQKNWEAIRYAQYLILSNSAFGILPALLNENVKEVIAPRYWARRNIKQWSMPSNYYKKFTYI